MLSGDCGNVLLVNEWLGIVLFVYVWFLSC